MEENKKLVHSIGGAVEASDRVVSRSEIYRAAARGELKIQKRGRRSFITDEELRRYLASLPTLKSVRAEAA